MAAGDPPDLAARALTEQLIVRLQAFLDGRETHESLRTWAGAAWRDHQQGLARTNRTARLILSNVACAADRHPPGDESQPYILRAVDVVEYLRKLQRGDMTGPVREVAMLSMPLPIFAERLGLDTDRYILDQLGWFEYLQFASPGSGRVFVLSRPLEFFDQGRSLVEFVPLGPFDPQDVLRDLFETFIVDHEDLVWLADDFDNICESLPRQTLWRQDDNGNRFAVATFTGARKAEAALQHFAALKHKQFYWLEDVPR